MGFAAIGETNLAQNQWEKQPLHIAQLHRSGKGQEVFLAFFVDGRARIQKLYRKVKIAHKLNKINSYRKAHQLVD